MLPPDDPRLQHRERKARLYLGDPDHKMRRREKVWFSRQYLLAFLLVLLFVVLLLALYTGLKN